MGKILVINTGGTISSESSGNVLSPTDRGLTEIIRLYETNYENSQKFEVINLMKILSENMNLKSLEKLFNCISENLKKGYDGIIVNHGSDTLSYTANMAGMLFYNSDKPIVFVAGNKELSDVTGNGLRNFHNAVCFINTSFEKGAFVSYSNNVTDDRIFDALNIKEADNFSDSFSSYDNRIFGKIIEGVFFKMSKRREIDFPFSSDKIKLEKGCLLIKPYPGMSYDNFSLDNVGAVVHYLYHSSTACVEGTDNSVIEFIKKCREKNIKFYIAPLKESGVKIYSSLEKISGEKGVEKLYDCSAEFAYAKALLDINIH